MEFIIISGQSGAGKSSAAAFLEDLGFYCVDNLPVALITSFAGICMAGAGTGKYSRVALVTDIRGGQTFAELFQALDELEQMDLQTLREFGAWLEQEGLQAIATRVSTGEECSIIISDGYVEGQEHPVMEDKKTEWKAGEF